MSRSACGRSAGGAWITASGPSDLFRRFFFARIGKPTGRGGSDGLDKAREGKCKNIKYNVSKVKRFESEKLQKIKYKSAKNVCSKPWGSSASLPALTRGVILLRSVASAATSMSASLSHVFNFACTRFDFFFARMGEPTGRGGSDGLDKAREANEKYQIYVF